MDQVFDVRQVSEKYQANEEKSILGFIIYLETAYDTIDQHGMWQMLRVNEIGGKLLKAVESFYVDSTRGRVDDSSFFEYLSPF